MSLIIKNWNRQIQKEIQEIEISVKNEKTMLKLIQDQIDALAFKPRFGPYFDYLIDQEYFLKYSIEISEQDILQLCDKLITCC